MPAVADKILVILPDSHESSSLVELLRQVATVQTASSLESAITRLQTDSFDLIIAPPHALIDAPDSATSLQLGMVLDGIDQGVCILDPRGRVIWSNSSHNGLPEQVRTRIQVMCGETYGQCENGGQARARSISLTTEDDRYFDATITPLAREGEETGRLIVVITEVTRARRLQRKMDAIDNAGRELVKFDADQFQKMNIRQRLELLERKILRYTRELLNFDNFAIRLLHKDTNKLEIVLCAGLPPEAQQIDIYASTENSGISGYVAATGRSYICPDVRNDPRYLRGINEARSSLTVPLYLHDQVIGTFNIEARTAGAFTEDDRQFT